MSHPPFDTWLLSDEPLDDEQRQMLDAHLEECEACNTLAHALTQVEETFTQHPSPIPAPGFTQRWQARFVIDRQERQHRRMWFFTVGLFCLAGLIVQALFFLNVGNVNWSYEISMVFANFSVFASHISQTFIVIRSLINAFPILLPALVVFGMGIFSLSAALIVTWFSSLIKIYKTPKEGVTVR